MESSIQAERLVKEFKKGPRAVDGIDLDVATRRDLRLPRSERRREVHHRAHAHHPPAAERRQRPGGGLRRRSARARASASRSERRCRRPRSTPSSPRASTCASRARSTGCRRTRGSAAARSCSRASGWSRPPTARSAPTRAACAAGSTWPSRSCTSRASCSSTSRPPASTRRAAARSGRRSSAWRARTASPSSSPPSTSRRPTASPTGWASSTMAGSSPRARPTSSRPRSAQPSVEAVPARQEDRERVAGVLARFAGPGDCPHPHEDGVAVRLDRGGDTGLADDRPRARPRGHRGGAPPAPRADARRRVPREDRPQPRGLGRGRGRGGADGAGARRGVTAGFATQVGAVAGRSMVRTARQPAQFVPALVFPLFLLAINAGGLDAATGLPGFPTDSYLTFALAVPVHPGRPVRRDERRHRPGEGHRDRFPQQAFAHPAERRGADHRAARRSRASSVSSRPSSS